MGMLMRDFSMNQDGFTAIDNRIYFTQEHLSPRAFSVLIRIHRMTTGYGEPSRGLSNTMLQTMCNMTKNTVTKAVNELVDSGFIFAKRRARATTIYAINYPKIYKFAEVKKDKETICFPNNDLDNGSQIMTQCIPNNDQVSSQNMGAIKENLKEKPLKKNIYTHEETKKTKPAKKSKTTKASVKKPDCISQQIWDDHLIVRKEKKSTLTVTAWKMFWKQVELIQEKTNHTPEQIMTNCVSASWTTVKLEWYLKRFTNSNNQIDRSTDKLAVNQKWHGDKSNIVEANTSIDEMLGGA